MKTVYAFVFVFMLACCGEDETASNAAKPAPDRRAAELLQIKDAVVPFFKWMQVREGDWLESHPEKGETFEEYLDSRPTLPTDERKTIFIQPIGTFTAEQSRVIQLTADYMRAFYNLPVKLNSVKPLGSVPKDMTRTVFPNNKQIQTSYFLDDVLPKLLPNDAAALICFTNYDLYPEETWYFVFGQASLDRRVGVWSLWRLGKGKPADERLLLSRTLKIAMHETGHMFSMRHCTKYECLMSGTNSLDETDRRPLDVCPECMTKIAWAMRYDPAERYRKLGEFWGMQGWMYEQNAMNAKAKAVTAAKNDVSK